MVNLFTEHITNEDAALLPALRFEGEVIVVDNQEQIAAACSDLLKQPLIGFDTETRPTFKPGPLNKVALLQLSTPYRSYLFRLCKIPLDKAIIKVLQSKTTAKIGADIGNDLRALQQLRHFTPTNFIDLQSIATQWGVAEKSVRKMAAIVLGGRVSKAQRLSNWEAATLTPAQQQYAATDAWVCLRMYQELMQTERKLSEAGDTDKKRPEQSAQKKKRRFKWTKNRE